MTARDHDSRFGDDVQFTLLLTVFLVVMVIFLFLRNFPPPSFRALALPMSIIGTFAVMWVLNYTLDNLSLMAITLAVGFVVDDAIVMLENIVRHMEMGKGVMEAALEGSREIGFTIHVDDLLARRGVYPGAVHRPGCMGRLLHEFAITIGAAILVSGFVSLSFDPDAVRRLPAPARERAPWPPVRSHRTLFRWFAGSLPRSLTG